MNDKPESTDSAETPEEKVLREMGPPATPALRDKPVTVDTGNTEKEELPSDEKQPDGKKDDAKSSTPIYRKKVVLIAAAVVFLVSGIGAAWALTKGSPEVADTQNTVQNVKLLGASVTIIDGTAEISADGKTWEALNLESVISQGDSIRTSENGRVVVAIDDGSAVRINSSSTATFTKLASTNIVIANDDGEIYTRVVESDRKFSVTVGDESYIALGTAYKTVNLATAKGVEVYQSEVSVKKAAQKIAEGKRYFQSSTTAELDKKVTDIPADQLLKDEFLKWNLEHDKQSSEFKNKLGYFTTLEKTPAPAPAPAPTPAPTASAGIKLTGTKTEKGASLTWTVTGITVSKGFKILKSLSANPTYGKDDSTFAEAASRSLSWKLQDGKTYNFRICVYNKDGTCNYYSNNVTVTVPYVAPPAPPTGSLSLSHVSGNNVAWTLSGSATYGLKLVSSESPNPVYPGNSAKYYDGASTTSATFTGDSGKTYYVRVCMYYEGTCVNYSNEISVTLP